MYKRIFTQVAIASLLLVSHAFAFDDQPTDYDSEPANCTKASDACTLEQTEQACQDFAWNNTRCEKEKIVSNCTLASSTISEVRGKKFGESTYMFSKSSAKDGCQFSTYGH